MLRKRGGFGFSAKTPRPCIAPQRSPSLVRLLRNRLKAAEKRLEELPDESDDPIVTIRRAIFEAGQPVFIDDLLTVLGHPITRDSREQLRRLLLPWVRRGEVFTRPRPSMFGLVELEKGR